MTMVMVSLVGYVVAMRHSVRSILICNLIANLETKMIVTIRVRPGKIDSHQLPVNVNFKVSLKMFPIAGTSGEKPKPRKVKVDS